MGQDFALFNCLINFNKVIEFFFDQAVAPIWAQSSFILVVQTVRCTFLNGDSHGGFQNASALVWVGFVVVCTLGGLWRW
jgi:hypothetical protein